MTQEKQFDKKKAEEGTIISTFALVFGCIGAIAGAITGCQEGSGSMGLDAIIFVPLGVGIYGMMGAGIGLFIGIIATLIRSVKNKKEKSLDQVDKGDVITFAAGDKIKILDRCDFNNRKFVYAKEIHSNKSGVEVEDTNIIMEILLKDNTLVKVINPVLLQEIRLRLNGLDKFTYDYFYYLIDRLVKWEKREEYCSLDIYDISITKDYKGSDEHHKKMHVAGYLDDSESDMNRFINMRNQKPHPRDLKFSEDVFNWFKVGKPKYDSTYEIYQDIGTFKNDDELISAMQFLEEDVKKKYPDMGIKFYIPKNE